MNASKNDQRPVLYLVASGSPAARHLADVVPLLTSRWRIYLFASPAGRRFVDAGALSALTGHPVRFDVDQPDAAGELPQPDAVLVAPATFNTVNKLAAGIADTLALCVVCEAIGWLVPTVVVPMMNTALAAHPAVATSIAVLRACGVTVIHDPATQPHPDRGPQATDLFPWPAALAALAALAAEPQ